MTETTDPHTEPLEERIRRAAIIVEALPYIRRFSNQVIVIKLGGAAIAAGGADSVLQDIVLLRFVGMRPVLVHGGGPEISAMQRQLGMEPRFVNGLRVTDEKAIDVVKMVLSGKVGPDLCARIHRLGGNGIGLSGEDGPTLLVRKRLGDNGEDLGFVGAIEQVNTEPIESILAQGAIPVIHSLGLGFDGAVYNVNADDVAAEIAVAMDATKCILLTDVDGIRDGGGTLQSELTPAQAAALVESGAISGGMIPKLRAALRAVSSGCTAHVIDGRLRHALLLELLTDGGVGTMVHVPAAEGAVVAGGHM